MDEHNAEHDAFPSENRTPGAGGAELRADGNTSEAEAFAFEQPDHEEAWEEESIPLSGEINATDTFITGESFRADPFQDLEEFSEPLDLSADDPFDPYRKDEEMRENALSRKIAGASTEFAGELSPSPGYHPSLMINRQERDGRFQAADNGGIQEDVPEGNKTFGWISIILAIASLFYWPMVLGPAAAVVGVIAYFSGNRALGVWSVVLGLVAIAAAMFLIPYYS
ncbi:hypothetical protein [Gorillibacterium sp. sgz5001074]|uniref:hypothetical protein n=1 Tax=Gorillibacterium sp. sgz5001074 TaxID=3446695 RepID=UPI003F680E0A